jgi:hypothetical protein
MVIQMAAANSSVSVAAWSGQKRSRSAWLNLLLAEGLDVDARDAERGIASGGIEFIGIWKFSLLDPHLHSTRANIE